MPRRVIGITLGDGAGILVQTPDRFLRKVAPAPLPPGGAAALAATVPLE